MKGDEVVVLGVNCKKKKLLGRIRILALFVMFIVVELECALFSAVVIVVWRCWHRFYLGYSNIELLLKKHGNVNWCEEIPFCRKGHFITDAMKVAYCSSEILELVAHISSQAAPSLQHLEIRLYIDDWSGCCYCSLEKDTAKEIHRKTKCLGRSW